MLKLFANRYCPYVQRVLIGIQVRGINATTLPIEWIDFHNPPEDLIRFNADWTVPTLQLSAHEAVDDSFNILRFFDSLSATGPKLFGATDQEASRQTYWTRRLIWEWIRPVRQALSVGGNARALAKACQRIEEGHAALATILDYALAGHDYLGGKSLGAADCMLAPFALQLQAVHELSPQVPRPDGRVAEYLDRLVTHSAVVSECPPLTEIVQGVAHWHKAPAALQKVTTTSKQSIADLPELVSSLNEYVQNNNLSWFWSLAQDGGAKKLLGTCSLKSLAESVEVLRVLDGLQQTVNHHATVELMKNTLTIALWTHQPTPSITQRDAAFAQALMEVFAGKVGIGPFDSSPFD